MLGNSCSCQLTVVVEANSSTMQKLTAQSSVDVKGTTATYSTYTQSSKMQIRCSVDVTFSCSALLCWLPDDPVDL